MFNKILIAEDFASHNMGVLQIIKELKIPIADSVSYCDDALLKIQRAIIDKKPYELLITDLSFGTDYREQKLFNGEDLIQASRIEQPDLKIIVFSVENRFHRVKKLFDQYNINGFVTKGRDDADEIKQAIIEVEEGKIYKSNIESAKNMDHLFEFEQYDITLVSLLAKSLTLNEVMGYFQKHKITPNSKSSIEKRLASLKIRMNCEDIIQLVFSFSDLGLLEDINDI